MLREKLPNGPAAAAIFASGIGCLALGLLTILASAITSLNQALDLYAPAGPLSGKTIFAVLIWLVAWGVAYLRWKNRDVDFTRVFAATLILVALGFLGTFPTFFEAFHP